MKDNRRPLWTPEKQALDELVREGKDAFVPKEPDWSKLEAKVMASVAKEPRPVVDDVRSSPMRSNVIRIGAAVLAAAAAVALFVGKDHESTSLEGAPTTLAASDVAGSLRSTEGAGEVRVGGLTASAGHVLRTGDVLEADGARAVLERPRKVQWLLEKGEKESGVAKVHVQSAAESLVLGLDDGSVEAQVVPVPAGEAFAVDVASDDKVVRVAVHGTHLRVTRNGSRVVVDLSEGVVSIGAPPRFGSTYGTLVTAPAHVELDVRDLEGTLKIDHTPASVRAPISLGVQQPLAIAPKDPAPAIKNDTAPQAPIALAPRAAVAGHPADTTAPAPAPAPAKAAVPPRSAIAQAVRDCAAQKSTRPSDVRVTINSVLKLQIGANGDVERAVFDPPLMPEIQTCAAVSIYKTKLEGESGAITVPIELSY